jgi:uncharacterized protein (DUF302 family)
MGFGFITACFGLLLKQITASQHGRLASSYVCPSGFGPLIGRECSSSFSQHGVIFALVRELSLGSVLPSRPSAQAVPIALFLALVGLAMATYLLSVRHNDNVQVQDKQEVSVTSTNAMAGIVDKPSNHSVDETVGGLKNILQSKGITLFALVDHSGEAEKIGMKMPPTKLLIFGNPKAGTPLMVATPSIAIDLPLKILVWEDAHKKTWVSYNSSAYLQERHNLPTELLQNIAVVETLAAKAAE